jgi:hypothetical protein
LPMGIIRGVGADQGRCKALPFTSPLSQHQHTDSPRAVFYCKQRPSASKLTCSSLFGEAIQMD